MARKPSNEIANYEIATHCMETHEEQVGVLPTDEIMMENIAKACAAAGYLNVKVMLRQNEPTVS